MTGQDIRTVKRALISVSNKQGVRRFAQRLIGHGVEIISTGGTASYIREAGLEVQDVSEVTGFPEMMDGRIKTLHPKIFGGLLGILENPEHVAAMEEHDIPIIDLAVVNLYPFSETVAKEGATHEQIIENIDIGGPALLRAAGKNYDRCAPVCDPNDYDMIIRDLKESLGLTRQMREYLAAKAFTHTAKYDTQVGKYLGSFLPQPA